VVVHEVGHTLGLRHNFKGSLVPPSTSVMDYLTNEDSLPMNNPGTYDTAAIQYLYGISVDLPKQPFCTDEDTVSDPDCNTFDTSADPLDEYYAKNYQQYLEDYLQARSTFAPNHSLNGVLQYVRASRSPQIRQKALGLALDAVRVGKVSANL